MQIGEIAKATGLPIPTIRYYEQQGVLPRPQRTGSGYRSFGQEDLQRLDFIKKAKRLGFSLAKIANILEVQAQQQPTCRHVRAALESKAAEVERTLRELQEFHQHLRLLIEQSAGLEDCRASGGRVCKIIERAMFEADLVLIPGGVPPA